MRIAHRRLRGVGIFILAFVAFGVCLIMWGGDLLVKNDSLPAHADAAIILEGSMVGERARLQGAMQLLQQGVPGRVLLPLPPRGYWGEPIPPMARHFLESNYGHDLADRVDFCVVEGDVDSTLQEAQVLEGCIREHHLQSLIVVTSDYHTRRAGMIWRRVRGKDDPLLRIWVHGVDDPEFQAKGWWRQRLWAKTWLMEATKLVWSGAVER